MGAALRIVNGDVAGAFKQRIISATMALRKWKREFKSQYILLTGTRTFDGESYFGGRVNTGELDDPDIEYLAELFGVNEDGKQEIRDANNGDVRIYMNLEARRIYTVDALKAHFQHEIAPNVPVGQVLTLHKTLTGDYITTTSTDLPALPTPRSFKVGKTDINWTVTVSSATGDTTVDTTLMYSYMLSDFIDNHADAVTLTTEFYDMDFYSLGGVVYYRHYWRTVATIALGATDTSWLGNAGYLDNELYPDIYISDDEADYGTDTGATGEFATLFTYVSGLLWNLVNDWGEGSGISFNQDMNTIEGTYFYSESLYINEAYWDTLSLLEATVLVAQLVQIKGEARDDGGFWGTFVGGFLKDIIGIVATVTSFIDALPVLNPMVLTIEWSLELAGQGKLSDDLDTVYRKFRTAVLTYVATSGGSAAMEGTTESGEFVEEWFLSEFEDSLAELGSMSLSELAVEFSDVALDAALEIAMPKTSTVTEPAEDALEKAGDVISFVYEEYDSDFVDSVYLLMENPLQRPV
ncbi:hypothetical protein WCX49_11700 [Sulfurimonas sp. HSL-1656]|uniref:hypothetical protein n=1 Tax=Thiomicrolovo subterrani TaxID=3131934 RepID=UPI0031F789C0